MALNKFTQIGNSGFGTDTSINTTGIVTAASFSGDGSGLTGVTALGSGVVVQEEGSNVGTAQTINFIGTGVTATFSGGIASVEIATSGGGGGSLSNVVEDTTPQLGGNLDLNSKNITGTGDINITGVVTATTFVGALTGDASGNAATATTLQNARTIGGVSFDGSANINLPGVNAAGNQDTSGTASVATNVTVADEASDTECFVMFGVNATGNNAPKSSSSLKYNSSTGGLSAGSFIGDGSGLTGITASGSGVIVRDGGSLVGTAGTIDFGSNVSVSPISAGVVTVTAAAGSIPGISTAQTTQLNNLTVAGVSTFTGAIDANSDLDVAGHISLRDNDEIRLGNDDDFYLRNRPYSGGFNYGEIVHTGDSLTIQSNKFVIDAVGGSNMIQCFQGGPVDVYYSGSKKFETSGVGVTITSQLDTTNIVASGVITATTFSGSGASLTNLPAANITGTLPAISGASLTTLNASELDSGTIPDARFPATLPAISGANLTNLPSDTPADTDVQVTFDVSSNGSSAYRITGPGYSGADNNPDIYLVRGQRYRFINTTGSGHPFRIQSDTSGTAYTDGVSGSQSGTQDFNVQHDAPVRLYYQCTIHSGMIGNIYIVGGSDWRMTDVATNATPEIFTNLNVGIGTDNPQKKLHVLGTSDFIVDTDSAGVRVGSYGEFDFALATGRNTLNNSSRFYIESGDGEAIRIDSNGLIGIKNGDPLYPMHFKNAMASTPSYIHMEVTGTNTVGGGGGIQFDTSASNSESNNGKYLATIHGERSASDNGSNTLIFKTSKSGVAGDDGNTNTPKTRMSIDEDGDVNISDGNLVVASGHGIDFSATANGTTSSSELFDDYEEGAWTPSITLGGGSTGMTYSRQEGHYTKIGRQVFAQFRITLTAKGSSTGQLRINGLPFTAADVFSSTGIDGQVHIAHDNGFNAGQVSNNAVSGYVEGATTYFLLTTRDTNANLNTMTNAFIDSDLSISGTVIFYA